MFIKILIFFRIGLSSIFLKFPIQRELYNGKSLTAIDQNPTWYEEGFKLKPGFSLLNLLKGAKLFIIIGYGISDMASRLVRISL